MTWKQACERSPHGMAVRHDRLGVVRRTAVCTTGGAVLVRKLGGWGRARGFCLESDLLAKHLLKWGGWQPLTGNDVGRVGSTGPVRI